MPIKALLVHPTRSDWREKHLELSLAQEGLTLDVAPVADAVDRAAVVRPDLILIDSALGESVSGELTTRLRACPQTGSTPIVLLTESLDPPTGAGRLAPAAGPAGWHPYELRGLRVVPVRHTSCRTPATTDAPDAGPWTPCSREVLELAVVTAALLVDVRVPGTLSHLRRVCSLAAALHAAYGDPSVDRQALLLGALLHDLGKVTLAPALLDKQTSLTLKEWFRVYTHPLESVALLQPVPFLTPAIPAVRSLHERWDGGGYPDGLSGDAIPVTAQMVGICEAFDAMTSPRPYREALSHRAATGELQAGAGTQFNPRLVEAFLGIEHPGGDPVPEDPHRARARATFERLTPRSWQVLVLFAGGVDTPACSSLLGIDRTQIGNYRTSLRRQLGLPPGQRLEDSLREHIFPISAGITAALWPGEG